MFYSKGFTCNGIDFLPCNVIYHPQCIKVGPPFRTRHYGKGTKGLQYPPLASKYPFICELCTTRTQLGRELSNFSTSDTTLLMLERMRMIDTAHASSVSTLEQYGRVLSNVDKFFDIHSLPPLHQQMNLSVINHPPLSLAITMFWSMSYYTTRPSYSLSGEVPTWNTGKMQRSALSFYRSWWASVCCPETIFKDKRRVLSDVLLGPTDNILSTHTASGMASRLGTESRPSLALNQRHIHWNQKARRRILTSNLSLLERYEQVAAQVAELVLWLGWLRSSETFGLRVADIEITPPKDHGKYDLPPDVGVILLRLLSTTKSQRDKHADMVIAFTTSSGLSLGYWLQELFKLLKKLGWYSPTCLLFQDPSHKPWTSHLFRQHHLYPYLKLQLAAGDVSLRHLVLTPEKGLEHFIYSMNSYRRGAESHCKRHREGCDRGAFPHEKSEHGRWRQRNQGKEDMPTHYTHTTIEDRVYITLLCF